jgi:hypothetical protein
MSTPFYDLASLVFLPSGYKSGKLYAQKPQTTDGQLTFTRASTATRVNASGLIETVASGVPRLDYYDSTCPKLLLEGQRSNLAIQNTAFDVTAAWTPATLTVVADDGTAPDGTNVADLIYPSANSTNSVIYNGASITSGIAYTSSIYVKASGKTWVFIRGVNDANGAYFNLSTGQLGTVEAGISATITAAGSGWYRCTVTETSSSTLGRLVVLVVDGNGSTAVTANGTDGLLIYGAQTEAGSYATSLILTTSAAVTRNADAASKTGITSLIGQTEGTIYLEADIQKYNESNFYFGISNGAALGEAIYLQQPTAGALNVLVRSSGSIATISISTANWTAGVNKVAFAYTSSSCELFVNGVSKGTASITNFPAALTQFTIGSRLDNLGTLVGSGPYSQALIFKTRLTNDQLAELTA